MALNQYFNIGDFGTVIVHSEVGMGEENNTTPVAHTNEISSGPGNIKDSMAHDLRNRSTDNWFVPVSFILFVHFIFDMEQLNDAMQPFMLLNKPPFFCY